MIINVRGTSGSGKTTAVRNILRGGVKTTVRERNSRAILGYILERRFARPTFIVGPYEGEGSGGCDALSSRDLAKVFSEVQYWHDHGFHVIFEGLLISRSKGRVLELCKAVGYHNLHILHLQTPLEDCLEGIRQRRMRRGNMRPVNRTRTEETYNRVWQIDRGLHQLGVRVSYILREDVPHCALSLLGDFNAGSEVSGAGDTIL